MESIPRHSWRTRLRRRIAALSVAIGFACLIAQAAGAWFIHHSLAETGIGALFPFVAVVCGLDYLRATRGRP